MPSLYKSCPKGSKEHLCSKQMATSTKRTIHGITWKDDLAWMEDMHGEKWKTFLNEQQDVWKELITPLKSDIQLLSIELDAAYHVSHARLFRAAGNTIEIAYKGSVLEWNWKGDKFIHQASSLDARRGGYVWVTEDDGSGAEIYVAKLYKSTFLHPLWQYKGVAPQLAVVGGRCYALEAKNTLVYYRLVSWDALTGKHYQVHYEEIDYRYNLELIRGDEQHAYLRRQSGSKQDLFMISSRNNRIDIVEPISLESRRFVIGSRQGEYLVWSRPEGWRSSFSLRKAGWKLPSTARAVPEYLDTHRGLFVTRWQGCRVLWRIFKNRTPYTLWRGWGDILIDPWDSGWVRFIKPGAETVWWNSKEDGGRPDQTLSSWNQIGICNLATSADGTQVPYFLLCSSQPAKGLLVVGYGAYGLSTPLMTQRWLPLLRRGWALAIGMWRGGGDHTPEWEDEGRMHGRERVLEDAEAVVRSARSFAKVSASKTILYGRSAGGLWVGGLLTKFPNGELAAGAYMEVPYLDVLRTTTNRKLPLTEIETDEFGLPEQRLSDLSSILRWSPMERMPPGGIPGVIQLIRTGLNDSEVFAYESAKWVVRSKNPAAILAIEGGQGHFVSGVTGREQQAQDLAVLLSLFTSR